MARFEFSNFAASPVTVDGITYPSAEAAYQAGKTDDQEWKKRLAAAGSPGAAKKMGRRVPLKANWDRLVEMEKVLRVKFAPGTEWAGRLKATGDRELVEWNTWHDVYWGRCSCPRCAGRGENHLGRLLQVIREELSRGACGNFRADRSSTL